METFFRDEWVEAWFALMCDVWMKNATPEALKYAKMPIAFISSNKNVTMDFVDRHPEIEWRLNWMQKNPNLTMDCILAHPEISWVWHTIAKHPSVTFDMILANPNLRKCHADVVANPNVTMEMIKTHEYFKECDFQLDEDENDNFFHTYPNSFIRETDTLEDEKRPTLLIYDFLQNPNISIDDEMKQLSTRNGELDLNLYESLRNIKCSKYHQIREITEMFNNKQISVYPCVFANEHLDLRSVKNNQRECWIFDFLYKNEMKHTKNNYIEAQIVHICISIMYEQIGDGWTCENNVEYIFADEYILSIICKY